MMVVPSRELALQVDSDLRRRVDNEEQLSRLKLIQGDVRDASETKVDVVARLAVDKDRHGPISSQERSRLWGPLSQVRLGFEEVIQHDTVIRPEHCGGPLCNLKGEVIGINISRVGRFETLAVTSKVVAASIKKILKTRR